LSSVAGVPERHPQGGIRPLMTIREAATLLNVHISTLRRWEKAGLITAVRLGPGTHRRYRRHQILGLVSGQAAPEPAAAEMPLPGPESVIPLQITQPELPSP
jgi:excisionase family DNA binding protein